MKKGVTAVLIIATAMFVAFISGLLLGRHISGKPAEIQPIKTEYIEASKAENTNIASDSKGKININTASATLLDTLPGIGPVLAERIVAYREKNGSFVKAEDIGLVDGIGTKTLLEILNLITVED